MNSNPHNPLAPESVAAAVSGSISSPAEETLRLIASLPAPAGLEDRVHAALRRRAKVRAGSGLGPEPETDWMRTAAAAPLSLWLQAGWAGTSTSSTARTAPGKVIAIPHGCSRAVSPGAAPYAQPQTCPARQTAYTVRTTARATQAAKKPAAQPAPLPSCQRPGHAERPRPRHNQPPSSKGRHAFLRVPHDGPDQHPQQRQHYCAPESRKQTVYMEPGNHARCHQDHDAVNHEQEDPSVRMLIGKVMIFKKSPTVAFSSPMTTAAIRAGDRSAT